MWVKSLLQMESGLKILEDCSQVNHFFEQNRLLDQSIRKILPSKDIGVSLLGNLKVSKLYDQCYSSLIFCYNLVCQIAMYNLQARTRGKNYELDEC